MKTWNDHGHHAFPAPPNDCFLDTTPGFRRCGAEAIDPTLFGENCTVCLGTSTVVGKSFMVFFWWLQQIVGFLQAHIVWVAKIPLLFHILTSHGQTRQDILSACCSLFTSQEMLKVVAGRSWLGSSGAGTGSPTSPFSRDLRLSEPRVLCNLLARRERVDMAQAKHRLWFPLRESRNGPFPKTRTRSFPTYRTSKISMW